MSAGDVERSGGSGGIRMKDISMKVFKFRNNLECPYCGRWILWNAARKGYMKKHGYFEYVCEQCGRCWRISKKGEGHSYVLR